MLTTFLRCFTLHMVMRLGGERNTPKHAYSPECVEGEFCEVGLPIYGVLRSSLGGCQRTLGWAAAAPTGWAVVDRLRTLKAIHAPLIATSTAPTSTVGGVLAGPIVAA
jgi:hypothetical protein